MEQINTKRCFRCGASEPPNQLFCGNCGIQMTGQQPTCNVQSPVQQPIINHPPNNAQLPGYPPQMASNYGQSAYNQPRQAGFTQPSPNNNQFGYGNLPNQFQQPDNYQNMQYMQSNSAPSRVTTGRLILAILTMIIGLISILSGLAAVFGGNHR